LHGSQYLIGSRFEAQIRGTLAELQLGMYVLASKPSDLALDYIHCDLTQLSELVE
jgi:hypothetical protein